MDKREQCSKCVFGDKCRSDRPCSMFAPLTEVFDLDSYIKRDKEELLSDLAEQIEGEIGWSVVFEWLVDQSQCEKYYQGRISI